jgi:hypothetical protein
VRRRDGPNSEKKHTFQSCLGRSTAKCSLGRSKERLEEEEEGERDGTDMVMDGLLPDPCQVIFLHLRSIAIDLPLSRHAIRSADSAKNGRTTRTYPSARLYLVLSLSFFIMLLPHKSTNFTEFLPNRYRPQPPNHCQNLASNWPSPALGSPQPSPSLIGKTLQHPYIHHPYIHLPLFSCGYALSHPHPTFPQGQYLLNSKLDSSKNSCPII